MSRIGKCEESGKPKIVECSAVVWLDAPCGPSVVHTLGLLDVFADEEHAAASCDGWNRTGKGHFVIRPAVLVVGEGES